MTALRLGDHRALAAKLIELEADLVTFHAALRGSHRLGSRTRLEARKAIAALGALRLALVEQLRAETIDHARSEYFGCSEPAREGGRP